MWGSIASLADNLKGAIESLETDLDAAVGAPSSKPPDQSAVDDSDLAVAGGRAEKVDASEEHAGANAHSPNQEEGEWAMLRAGQAAAAAIIAADEQAANAVIGSNETATSELHGSGHAEALEAIELAQSAITSGGQGEKPASDGNHGEISTADKSVAEAVSTEAVPYEANECEEQAPQDSENALTGAATAENEPRVVEVGESATEATDLFPEEATATAAAKAETPNDEAVAIEPAPTEDAQVVAATSDEAKRDDAGPEAAVVIAKLASAAAAAAAAISENSEAGAVTAEAEAPADDSAQVASEVEAVPPAEELLSEDTTEQAAMSTELQEDAPASTQESLPATNQEEMQQQQQQQQQPPQAVVGDIAEVKLETSKGAAQATSPRAGTPASKKKAKKQRQQQLKREAAEQAAAAEAAAAEEEESPKAVVSVQEDVTSDAKAAEEAPHAFTSAGTAESPPAEPPLVETTYAGLRAEDASASPSSPPVDTSVDCGADASTNSSSSAAPSSSDSSAAVSPPLVHLANLSVDEGAAAAETSLKDWCSSEHGRAQLEAVLTAADSNGDGLVSLREFNSALEAAGCRGATGKQVRALVAGRWQLPLVAGPNKKGSPSLVSTANLLDAVVSMLNSTEGSHQEEGELSGVVEVDPTANVNQEEVIIAAPASVAPIETTPEPETTCAESQPAAPSNASAPSSSSSEERDLLLESMTTKVRALEQELQESCAARAADAEAAALAQSEAVAAVESASAAAVESASAAAATEAAAEAAAATAAAATAAAAAADNSPASEPTAADSERAVSEAVAEALAEAAAKAEADKTAAVEAERATAAAAAEAAAEAHTAQEEELQRAHSEALVAAQATHAAELEARMETAAASAREAAEELKERLAERERQLKSAASALADANGRVGELEQELMDKEAGWQEASNKQAKQLEAAVVARGEAEAKVAELAKSAAMAQSLAGDASEKDAQVAGLIAEGQQLAKKQGELQKLVRDKNAKVNELEASLKAAIAEKDTLTVSVANLNETLASQKQAVGDRSKSLAAMQAASQASSDRLSTVETELRASRDSEADLRLALDKAWAAEKDLKRQLHSSNAEVEALSARLGQGEASSVAHAENLREFEVRESMLQATQRQLEDAMTRAAHEASLREDALRAEVADMRRRWQDATQRSEGIAADVHESTSPLLRQIRALQEEGRARASAWASAESALSDRAIAAEESASVAEAKAHAAQTQAAEAHASNRLADQALRECKLSLAVAIADGKAASVKASNAADRIAELEAELESTSERQAKTQRELKTSSAKAKLLLEEAQEQLASQQSEWQAEKGSLEEQNARLTSELHELKRKCASGGFSRHNIVSSNSSSPGKGYDGRLSQGNGSGINLKGTGSEEAGGDEAQFRGMLSDLVSQGPGHQPDSRVTMPTQQRQGGGGSGFVVELEKLHLLVKQREAEAKQAKERLKQVESVCAALTSEVQELGRRNTALESAGKEAPTLRKQCTALTKKNNVLLELLGEKTEALEELQADLDDVKKVYRTQLEQVMGHHAQQQQQAAPPAAPDAT